MGWFGLFLFVLFGLVFVVGCLYLLLIAMLGQYCSVCGYCFVTDLGVCWFSNLLPKHMFLGISFKKTEASCCSVGTWGTWPRKSHASVLVGLKKAAGIRSSELVHGNWVSFGFFGHSFALSYCHASLLHHFGQPRHFGHCLHLCGMLSSGRFLRCSVSSPGNSHKVAATCSLHQALQDVASLLPSARSICNCFGREGLAYLQYAIVCLLIFVVYYINGSYWRQGRVANPSKSYSSYFMGLDWSSYQHLQVLVHALAQFHPGILVCFSWPSWRLCNLPERWRFLLMAGLLGLSMFITYHCQIILTQSLLILLTNCCVRCRYWREFYLLGVHHRYDRC